MCSVSGVELLPLEDVLLRVSLVRFPSVACETVYRMQISLCGGMNDISIGSFANVYSVRRLVLYSDSHLAQSIDSGRYTCGQKERERKKVREKARKKTEQR